MFKCFCFYCKLTFNVKTDDFLLGNFPLIRINVLHKRSAYTLSSMNTAKFDRILNILRVKHYKFAKLNHFFLFNLFEININTFKILILLN